MAPARRGFTLSPPPPSESSSEGITNSNNKRLNKIKIENSDVRSSNGSDGSYVAISSNSAGSYVSTASEVLANDISDILGRFKSRGKNGLDLDQAVQALIRLYAETSISDSVVAPASNYDSEDQVVLEITETVEYPFDAGYPDLHDYSSASSQLSIATAPATIECDQKYSPPAASVSWHDYLDFDTVQKFKPSTVAKAQGGTKAYHEFCKYLTGKLAEDGHTATLKTETKKAIISEAYKTWKDLQDDGPGASGSGWGSTTGGGKSKKLSPAQAKAMQQLAEKIMQEEPDSTTLTFTGPPGFTIHHDTPGLHNPIHYAPQTPFRDPFTFSNASNSTGHPANGMTYRYPSSTPAPSVISPAAPSNGTGRQLRSSRKASQDLAGQPSPAAISPSPTTAARSARTSTTTPEVMTWPSFQATTRNTLKSTHPNASKEEIKSIISNRWVQYKQVHGI